MNKGQPLLQCKQCFKLGHHLRKCRGEPICNKCGRARHEGKCTQPKLCVLCKKEGNSAAAYSCPSRKRAQAELRNNNAKKWIKRNPSADPDGFRQQGRYKLPKTVKQAGALLANNQAATAPAAVNPPAPKVLTKSARKRRNKKSKSQQNKNKMTSRDVEKITTDTGGGQR